MDNTDDLSTVKLDDENDPSYDVGRDDSISADPSDIREESQAADMDVGDGQYKRITNLTSDDVMGLEFVTQHAAYKFYEDYAKAHGFVVRKDDIRKDFRGNTVMRQFVCNRQGLRNKKHFMRVDRKREHRAITRTNCGAKLRVRFNRKKSKWIVVSFEEAHNHELTPSVYVHLYPSYRKMSDADKAQVDSLRAHGVRTCHIIGYMLAQKGEYGGLGFCKTDVYNYIDNKSRVQVKDGDAIAALSYLAGKAQHDPTLFAQFQITTKEDFKTAMYSNFTIDEFEEFWKKMLLKHGLKIERDASKIYTLEMFKEVRQEIDKAGALIVVDRNVNDKKFMFTLNQYCNRGREMHVLYDASDSSFSCDCRLFEIRGIPCSHIFCAMKNEHVESIPTSLILKRWMKTAKSDFINSIESREVHSDVLDGARLSALTSYSSNFVKVAYENKGCFNEIVDDLFKLTLKYQKKTISNGQNSSSSFIISDLTIVKTRGAPKKKKTCPKLGGTDVKGANDDEFCPSESTDSSGKNDSDKEPFSRDVGNDQQCSQSNNVSKSNDKKGKAKVPVTCIRKEKKLGKSGQIQMKEVKKEGDIGCTDLKTENDQRFASFTEISIPPYANGPVSQRVPILPRYDAFPSYCQNPQFPFFPQAAQFYPPIQNMNGRSSWNQLLQQVMQNKGQSSGNNMNS
ncbi:Zinc finger, PMZ-type [Sesbania bispinosa]|nr:Zinc finger, PMZ-type [Sesbania bispinosa]